VRFRR